jgi:DNA-binding protein HU-beta
MNKTELISAIAEQTDLPQHKVKEVITLMIDIISEKLAAGETINLVGFGSFLTVKRESRTGRNPKTGEEMKIKESITPKFRPGKALKDKVAADTGKNKKS